MDKQGAVRPTPPVRAPPRYLVDRRIVAPPLPSWNRVRDKPQPLSCVKVRVVTDTHLSSVARSTTTKPLRRPVEDSGARSTTTQAVRRPVGPIGAPANVVRRHARPERVPKGALVDRVRAVLQRSSMTTRVKHTASNGMDSGAENRSSWAGAVTNGRGVSAVPVKRTSKHGGQLPPRDHGRECDAGVEPAVYAPLKESMKPQQMGKPWPARYSGVKLVRNGKYASVLKKRAIGASPPRNPIEDDGDYGSMPKRACEPRWQCDDGPMQRNSESQPEYFYEMGLDSQGENPQSADTMIDSCDL